jgi:heme/copper-type cytochrome/quinol oxidase subunit 2
MNFQAPATPIMEGIIDLHHDIMATLIMVFLLVVFTLKYFLQDYNAEKNFYLYDITHSTK